MDPENDREMPRHETGLHHGASGGTGVHVDPDHELGTPFGREVGLLEKTGELDLHGPDRPLPSRGRLDRVAGLRQIAFARLSQNGQSPVVFRPLQGEIEVLGEPSQPIKKPEGGSALKCQRREGRCVLQRPEDVGLEILSDQIEPLASVRL